MKTAVLAPFAWFVFLAFLANWPYVRAPLAFDDFIHLATLGDVSRGARGFWTWIFEPHNMHWIPLWKLGFWCHWRWMGFPSVLWHVNLIFLHATLGWLLYLLLRAYSRSWTAPWIAASIWSGSSFNSMDNPCIWISSSHLSLALAWLLLAFILVAVADRLGKLLGGFGLFITLLLAIGSMGAIVVVMPFVAIAIFLHGWKKSSPYRPLRTPLLLAWGLALAMGTGLQWWAIRDLLPQLEQSPTAAETFPEDPYGLLDEGLRYQTSSRRKPTQVPELAMGTLLCFASGLEQLLNIPRGITRPDVDPRPRAMVLGIAALAGLATGVWLLRANAVVVAISFTAVAVYTLLVVRGRAELGPIVFVAWGRYGYATAIFWAIGLGTLLDPAMKRASATTLRWAVPILVGLLLAFTGQGRSLALYQLEARHRNSGEWMQDLAQADRLIAELGEQASGRPFVFLEFTVVYPASHHTLSAYMAYRRLGAEAIEVRDARRISPEDLERTLTALDRSNNPLAKSWAASLRQARGLAEWFQAGLQLAQPDGVGEGEGEEVRTIRLPHSRMKIGVAYTWHCDAVAQLFPDGVEGIRFADPADLTFSEYQRLDRLAQGLELETFWRMWLAQMRDNSAHGHGLRSESGDPRSDEEAPAVPMESVENP